MQQPLEKALQNTHPETARIIMNVSKPPAVPMTKDTDEALVAWLTGLISTSA